MKITLRSKEDFIDGYDDRLRNPDLKEGEIYSFMGRLAYTIVNHLRRPKAEAVMIATSLENIRKNAGRLGLDLCLKDQDLRTAVRLDSVVEDGVWRSNTGREASVKINGNPKAVIHDGYFLPYEDGIEIPTLDEIMSLGQ